MTQDMTKLQIELHDILVTHFDESELQDLYFQLGVDYGNTLGVTKRDKARELILYLSRRDSLLSLVELVTKERPGILNNVVPDEDEPIDTLLMRFRERIQEKRGSETSGSMTISIGDNASGVIAGQNIRVNTGSPSQQSSPDKCAG